MLLRIIFLFPFLELVSNIRLRWLLAQNSQVRIEYTSLLGTRDEHIFLFDRTGDHQYSATSLYEVSEQCKGYMYWDLNPHLERGECIASLLTQKRPVLKAVEVFD